MHPYSKDTHSLPTINVNMKKCRCVGPPLDPKTHWDGCAGAPIPLPLSLQPFRSVTFTVVLGTCGCAKQWNPILTNHGDLCPGEPIRVSCSISGGTWEESDVCHFEWQEGPSELMAGRIEALVTQRWALVKALVLGRECTPHDLAAGPHEVVIDLFQQRDAVFSELSALVCDEQSAFARQERVVTAMGEATYMPHNFHRAEPHARASADLLARYVERLVEQVRVLP